jgi:hypothetical protein
VDRADLTRASTCSTRRRGENSATAEQRIGDFNTTCQTLLIADYRSIKHNCYPQARTLPRESRSERALKTSHLVRSARLTARSAVDNAVDKKVIERGLFLLSVRTRSGINRS